MHTACCLTVSHHSIRWGRVSSAPVRPPPLPKCMLGYAPLPFGQTVACENSTFRFAGGKYTSMYVIFSSNIPLCMLCSPVALHSSAWSIPNQNHIQQRRSKEGCIVVLSFPSALGIKLQQNLQNVYIIRPYLIPFGSIETEEMTQCEFKRFGSDVVSPTREIK